MNAMLAFALLLSAALVGTTQKEPSTIVVSYGAIGCTCAQWAIQTKSPGKHPEYIYVERGKAGLPDADDLWDGTNIPLQLRLTGHFKPGKGFPEGLFPTKGNPDPARVFRYTSLIVLKNGHHSR
jgi:hypothetical protein